MAYPFCIATQLQYYVKHEKCKVHDVIVPSSCEARAVNLGNKNVKIGFFTGRTSVRSKNIFTDISRYPTGKHEIKFKPSKDMDSRWPRNLILNWVNPFSNKALFFNVSAVEIF